MKKRILAALMGLVMAASLAGCGSSNSSSAQSTTAAGSAEAGNSADAASSTASSAATSSSTTSSDDEETVELNMVWISMGTNIDDAQAMQDALNDYIEPKIHARVNIEWLDMGDYMNQLNLKLASGEQIDVLPTFGQYFPSLYAQEALMDITDLLQERGQSIIDVVGEDYMKAGQIDGRQYAIPSVTAFARQTCFFYRTDIAEQYGLDMSNVKSMSDLTDIFAELHEKDPELTIVAANNPNTSQLYRFSDWDPLTDEYGVLMDPTSSTEVTDLFESDKYAEYVNLMREWYEAGYTQVDAATTSDNLSTIMSAGNTFGTIYRSFPGEVEDQTNACQVPLGSVALADPLATTDAVMDGIFCIPETAEYPEKALDFINLMYTDPVVENYILYGIEGQDYQVVDAEKGIEDYLDGQDMMSCKYVNLLRMGNKLIAYSRASDPEGLNESIEEFNEDADKSLGLGFSYDSTPVSNELAAIENVVAKYRRGLECGSLDPSTELPKFIDELKTAGIDTVIAEKQSQLDAWLQN